jgi:hypothetical protein
MIEPSALPYVDLSNSADALRAYAQEHFGKKISANAKDETVRERFAQIYHEETGAALPAYDPAADKPPVDDDDDDGDQDSPVHTATNPPGTKEKKTPKYVVVNLQEDPSDIHDVKLGLNFRTYLIQRNVDTKIPFALLGVLRDSKRTVYNPKTMVAKEVPAYPFSILEYTDED